MNDGELIPRSLIPIGIKQIVLRETALQDISDGLIFRTEFNSFSGNDVKDQSGNNSDVTISGATKISGYVNGNALNFDGTDDYCYQKIYDTEQGAVSIVVADGSATLTDDGQDFTAYASALTDKKYMVVVRDQENDIAWGYIGALDGGATSVALYSTRTGSTRNLAGKAVAFDDGDTLTYEIRRSVFNDTFTNGFTIGVWINVTSIAGAAVFISKYDYGINQRAIRLQQDATETVTGYISVNGVATVAVTSTSTVDDSQWHFIVFTYVPSTSFSVYIDGVSEGENTTTIPASIFDVPIPFNLGGNYSTGSRRNEFKGKMQNPFIYNKTLTASEILQLYNYQLIKLGVAG